MKMNKLSQLAAFGASLFNVLSVGTYILSLIFLHDNPYQAYVFVFFIAAFLILAAVCSLIYLVLLAFDYFRKKKETSN
jgi:uncharacterized membrane protein HdeD (DUF308 family)